MKKKTTTNAVKILHNIFIKDDPKRLASLEEEREKLKIAGQIYDLRTQAGLSQAQLAKLVGTTQSVISRLEDADYMRLKNLEFGYNFSSLPVVTKMGLSDLRIYFSGSNLITWSNLSDFDPESSSSTSYPLNKIYNLGISLTF